MEGCEMNRLEKLKEEFWIAESEDGTQEIVKGNIKVGDNFYSGYNASYYTAVKIYHLTCVNELDAASAEYEKIIAELEAALKEAKSCYSCIRHNCKIDSFLLALDVGSQITIKHIDYSEKQVREALQKLKEFRGGE